ncbi:MAG: anthranilate phosphoribosyltransferase, partial [Myxococcota bacterium]
MRELLEKICMGNDLTRAESAAVFEAIVSGSIGDAGMGALLAALRTKGESPEDIAGAAEAMLRHAVPVECPGLDLCDNCGTGGDGAGTMNISTAAAVVASEAGLKVAKHGNRSVSSGCGSADVLELCGVKIDALVGTVSRNLREAGICFIFAPLYHPGMKHAMPVRKALGIRTIFNVLGPIINPARPRYQLMGVYDPSLCLPIAKTLRMLGRTAAIVVHGSGLDELALHGESRCAVLKDGNITEMTVDPESAGLVRAPIQALRGGDARVNAAKMKEILA